jgi:xylulokinase
VPIDVPPAEEYVALGAARQAAWVLDPATGPPAWEVTGAVRTLPRTDTGPSVRARYAEARDLTLSRPGPALHGHEDPADPG